MRVYFSSNFSRSVPTEGAAPRWTGPLPQQQQRCLHSPKLSFLLPCSPIPEIGRGREWMCTGSVSRMCTGFGVMGWALRLNGPHTEVDSISGATFCLLNRYRLVQGSNEELWLCSSCQRYVALPLPKPFGSANLYLLSWLMEAPTGQLCKSSVALRRRGRGSKMGSATTSRVTRCELFAVLCP